ncbi:exopolysaccharide biosynthesis protein [Verticiella sediminum]|uniref:Exopolysaccharide biosynthesis protein n=2 Tax=Verticiella sediminum TaxID=1247510 RepID=A0A556ACY7_9BURK|nr:exopolysaccharide biosynthesis protein [Verticiella sediminum]
MLDRLEFAECENDKVSVEAMLDITGRRSFGPMLLVPGLLVLSPVSGVPGVPTLSGAMVLLLSVQLLIGRQHFWMPRWVLKRGVSQRRLLQAFRFMRPPARWIDRLVKPRMRWLVESHAVYAVAAICALVALTMPPLELVPFAATAAGIAITTFGLALIGRDGLLAMLAFIFCGVTGALLAQAVL